MNENLDKIRALVLDSLISDKEKSVIYDLLKGLPELDLGNILNLIESNLVDFDFLKKNLEEKSQALKNNDKELFDKIIKEELELLKNIKE